MSSAGISWLVGVASSAKACRCCFSSSKKRSSKVARRWMIFCSCQHPWRLMAFRLTSCAQEGGVVGCVMVSASPLQSRKAGRTSVLLSAPGGAPGDSPYSVCSVLLGWEE